MRKLIILLLLYSGKAFATNYYVSATGNNAAAGTSIGTAWQTIVKVNSFASSFVNGDSLLFRKGDTFFGGIILTKSVKVGWYGTGAKPIITGLVTISSWTNLGGNIWEANTSSVKVDNNMVIRNGLPQQVGRYPNVGASNGGYLTNTATTSTTITGPALSSVTNWTGAEVVYRERRWTLRHGIVLAHSGGVITFPSTGITPLVGFGYFFQRDSRTLDQDGEWWQDGTNNKLRMYFGNNNPAVYTIEVATVDTLLTGPDNVSVDGLFFKGAGKHAICFNGRINPIVKNCDIYNSGDESLRIWFCINVTVTNNTLTNNLGGGIRAYSTANLATKVNHLITDNTVRNTAYIAGMESSGQNCAGIQSNGGNTINVFRNIVTNSGYNGIEFYGNTVKVKYNFIDTSCLVRDDGGGIYTWVVSSGEPVTVNSDRAVVSNTILHSLGQNFGTNSSTFETSAQGMYLDGASRYVIVDSNTIAYVNGNGLHGNGNTNNYYRYNTLFNCNNSISFQRFAGSNPMTNIFITKNIISPYRFSYRNLSINSPATTANADILAMGTLDSNYYSLRTGTDTSLIAVTTNADGSSYAENNRTFSYITGTIGQETHSINFANTGTLYTNPTGTLIVVNFSGLNKKDAYNNNYSNFAVIPAWSSKILIPNGTSNIPPVANAGVDKTITLPINTVTLTGTGTDADGTVTGYSWFKLSGVTGDVISSPSSASTVVSFTTAGTYQYVLTVTDNLGTTGKDTVQVTVIAARLVAPTVNAGVDQTLQLPTFASLLATVTGNIATVTWSFISVPGSTSVLTTPTTLATTVTGLSVGIYSIKCTVLDFNGLSARDTMQLTVIAPPANIPPTVDAIAATTIQLPVSSTSATAVGRDVDGTIASYAWTQVTGPNTATITNASSSGTNFTGLVQGFYSFKVTVTDNSGATGSTTFQVTVLAAIPPANQPPVVSANASITIMTLPANSTTLVGTATDADGTIASVSWTKISGPATFTIGSPTSLTSTFSGLVAGVYQLKFKAIDNIGDTAVAYLQITVNAAPAVTPPSCTAGTSNSYTLPISSTVLTSVVTAGTYSIASYLWTQTGGVATTITNGTTTTATITGIAVSGTYQYLFKATDINGNICSTTFKIVVFDPSCNCIINNKRNRKIVN